MMDPLFRSKCPAIWTNPDNLTSLLNLCFDVHCELHLDSYCNTNLRDQN